MKLEIVALGAVLAVGSSAGALAAASALQFPPRTVSDLLAICSVGQNDPMRTAAVSYCNGVTLAGPGAGPGGTGYSEQGTAAGLVVGDTGLDAGGWAASGLAAGEFGGGGGHGGR